MTGVVRVKRIYAPAGPDDGRRVLVDRIWPRGVVRADARVDLWMKDLAPSTRLRRWYGHRPELWPQFRSRYLTELADNPFVDDLLALAEEDDVTLLFAARDEVRNNAVVLADLVRRRLADRRTAPRPLPLAARLHAKAVARWENEGGATGAEKTLWAAGSLPAFDIGARG